MENFITNAADYFTPSVWNDMGSYEKGRYNNTLQIYLDMKKIGKNILFY